MSIPPENEKRTGRRDPDHSRDEEVSGRERSPTRGERSSRAVTEDKHSTKKRSWIKRMLRRCSEIGGRRRGSTWRSRGARTHNIDGHAGQR